MQEIVLSVQLETVITQLNTDASVVTYTDAAPLLRSHVVYDAD